MLEKIKETELNKNWTNVLNTLFPSGIPDRAIWTGCRDIAEILNKICNLNYKGTYTFLPVSGGLELVGATNKGSYLDLIAGQEYSVKPYRLVFDYISNDIGQSYFWLEGLITFCCLDEDKELILEPAVDLNYEDSKYRTFGKYGDGYIIKKATFVIFNKNSLYNQAGFTDDGRHNNMSLEEFKLYVTENYSYKNI